MAPAGPARRAAPAKEPGRRRQADAAPTAPSCQPITRLAHCRFERFQLVRAERTDVCNSQARPLPSPAPHARGAREAADLIGGRLEELALGVKEGVEERSPAPALRRLRRAEHPLPPWRPAFPKTQHMCGLGEIEAKQAPKAPSISFDFLPFLSENPALSIRCAGDRAKKKIHCPSSPPEPCRTWRRWAGVIQKHHGALILSLANSMRATGGSNAKHQASPWELQRSRASGPSL